MDIFASSRIMGRFLDAAATFLEAANNSLAANTVLERLIAPSANYESFDDRNELVKCLAGDVEARIGCSANLLFRTPGTLHDALQSLLEAYLDAADGIYYTEPTHITADVPTIATTA
jgi:hypothetical protein